MVCRTLNGIGKRGFESPILESTVQNKSASICPANTTPRPFDPEEGHGDEPNFFCTGVFNFHDEEEKKKNPKLARASTISSHPSSSIVHVTCRSFISPLPARASLPGT